MDQTSRGTIEMHTKFYSGNRKGRDHLQELIVDGKIILELILKE
jgi:hypothetical protein